MTLWRQLLRSRALWAALSATAVAAALLATLQPVREATHTALGWLRTETLTIEAADAADAADAEPQAPPDAFQVEWLERAGMLTNVTGGELADLPFDLVTLDPPRGFVSAPVYAVAGAGTMRVSLDSSGLQALLDGGAGMETPPGGSAGAAASAADEAPAASSSPQAAPPRAAVRLASGFADQEFTVAGGAVVMTTWAAANPGGAPLTLVQIEPPTVSGLTQADLRRLSRVLGQLFLPPIVSAQVEISELPLVRDALGLNDDADDADEPPRVTELPDGSAAVTWTAGRATLILTGPLPPDDLRRLAAAAA